MAVLYPILLVLFVFSCASSSAPTRTDTRGTETLTFENDLQFLRKYLQIDVLMSPDGSGLVACSPDLQGRVMTSSATGLSGTGLGWINRALFESGDTLEHINPFGGEERFWLGPEGGQFSIFFKEGDPFNLDTWQTPRLIDLVSFNRIEKTKQRVVYQQTGQLTNYSGFVFDLKITRSVEILSQSSLKEVLDLDLKGVDFVAYQTHNVIANIGQTPWTKETGLLSIWLLGMFKPSEHATVIIPYQTGSDHDLGPIVNDAYFGKVPSERLQLKEGVVLFRADGQYRSKIGLSPLRAKNILGAYNGETETLTIVKYSKPPGMVDYVNSMWEIQEQPFAGDAINSYNDGPLAPGVKPLGPFYELETSSPALALQPGEEGQHQQLTLHLRGSQETLNKISTKIFGIDLATISERKHSD